MTREKFVSSNQPIWAVNVIRMMEFLQSLLGAVISLWRREISAVFSGYLGKRLFVLKKIPYFCEISVRKVACESERLFRLLFHEKGAALVGYTGRGSINHTLISIWIFRVAFIYWYCFRKRNIKRDENRKSAIKIQAI